MEDIEGMGTAVMREFARLVREILTQIEAWTADEEQRRKQKKIMSNIIYDCRNRVLEGLKIDADGHHRDTKEK